MRGNGRIFCRGTTWWIAYCRGGKEYRESSKSDREAEAKRLLRQRLGELHSGTFVGPRQERLLLRELLDVLERDYTLNGKKNIKSLKGYRKHIEQFFPLDRAIDVTESRLEVYKEARLAEKAAPASINRELAAIGRAFTLGVEQRLVTTRPKIRKLKEDNVRTGFVERADFEAIAAQLPDHLADVARFAYLTAWRKSEVTGLLWSDVDLQGLTVHLRGSESKNSRGRVVALVGELEALIRKRESLRTYQPKDEKEAAIVAQHVFHHRGEPIGDFRKAWAAARAKAGLSETLVHDLRRSGVRNLIRSGAPQSVAMKISGHQTEHVFRRYDIVDDRDLRQAMERQQAYLDAQTLERKVRRIPPAEERPA